MAKPKTKTPTKKDYKTDPKNYAKNPPEPKIPPIDREKATQAKKGDAKRKGKKGDTYNPEYAEIAYEILIDKNNGGAKTTAHVAAGLRCSKQTIKNWRSKYPEFDQAFENGLAIGEMHFRNRISGCAFLPSANVNNGMIKILFQNVYKVKIDEPPTVEIKNFNQKDL